MHSIWEELYVVEPHLIRIVKSVGLPIITPHGDKICTFSYLWTFLESFRLKPHSESLQRDLEIVAMLYKNEDLRKLLITFLYMFPKPYDFGLHALPILFEKLGVKDELQGPW